MKKLNITESLIYKLIYEVSPIVEEITGWSLLVDSLSPRVLPKDRGYEEVLLGRLQGAGIEIDEEHPRTLIERLIEYIVEANVLAAYQPSTNELLIIRENVDDSNLDGLKLVVAHELVHRGQHVNYGHLFECVDDVFREVFYSLAYEEATLKDIIQKMSKIKPIMTLLESHAYYIQELLRKTHYPNAEIESHFNLATILLRLLGQAKLSQYTEGIPEIASAIEAGDIDSLYSRF